MSDYLRALIASNDHINAANLAEALPALIAERDELLAALRKAERALSAASIAGVSLYGADVTKAARALIAKMEGPQS